MSDLLPLRAVALTRPLRPTCGPHAIPQPPESLHTGPPSPLQPRRQPPRSPLIEGGESCPRHAGGKPNLPKQGHPINDAIGPLEKFAEKVNGPRSWSVLFGSCYVFLWGLPVA